MIIDLPTMKNFIYALLGYEPTDRDNFIIEFAIQERTDYVLSYCNRNDIPPRLRSQLMRMIVGEFLYQKKLMGGAESLGFDVEPLISSYEEGDTKTDYRVDGDTSMDAALDAFINQLRWGNAVTLQEYRKLKW